LVSRYGHGHVELADQFLSAGIHLFQVRDKTTTDSELYSDLREISEMCKAVDACLIVNDRVDLVLATGASGIHLGQTDLPVSVARRLLGDGAIIGKSTHTRDQFLAAQNEDIDYVALGPIFDTATKTSAYPPLGTTELLELAPRKRLPLVAIGGITLESARSVWESGADSVAVISDLVDRRDPTSRIYRYLGEYSR
jgi:thiamine-phosphate pyrophosphorylase